MSNQAQGGYTNQKSTGTTALIVLLLLVTIAALILATYAWAKYTSSQSANAAAPVAKWDVSFSDNSANTFVGSYTHVVTDKIAPGTSGSFTVTPDAGNTEVCFNYSIVIDSIKFLDGDGNEIDPTTVLIPADNSTTPATPAVTFADFDHIKLYNGSVDASNLITVGTTEITGTYDLTDHNSTTGATNPAAKTVTWDWQFTGTGNYDAVDTAVGEYAAAHGLQFQVNYTATATQVQPNS